MLYNPKKHKKQYQSFYGSPIRLLHNSFLKQKTKIDLSNEFIVYNILTRSFLPAPIPSSHGAHIQCLIYIPRNISEYDFYYMLKKCSENIARYSGQFRVKVNTIKGKNKLRNERYRDFLMKQLNEQTTSSSIEVPENALTMQNSPKNIDCMQETTENTDKIPERE